jgi:ATP-binding cassette subfamily C (CFTR/MRP) protein 1
MDVDVQNNVERVQHFRELPSEPPARLSTDPGDKDIWPREGAVSFEVAQLRYRPELPLVLKGVTFDVKPGEKVGIIGRTGAGKSSMAQALFRAVELSGGRIVVDGRDLKDLGLDTVGWAFLLSRLLDVLVVADFQVRGRMSIIPQDAFLFGGTVR